MSHPPPDGPPPPGPDPDPAPGEHRAPAAERRRAVVRAGHLGDAATARAHLADPDPGVRAAALGALSRTGTLGAADLADGLRDPDPSVRGRAARVAADAGHDAVDHTVVQAVASLLDDDHDRVVEVACFALGEVGTRPGGPEVAGLVERLSAVARSHSDALCRESAVAALGSLGHPDGLTAVLAGCRDRASVRRRAVLALAAFDDPAASAELRRLLGDRDLQVSQAAEDLVAIEDGTDVGSAGSAGREAP